jgi:hypothetical protein
MEGNVRSFEDLEEAGAIGTDADEQAVEGNEAGLGGEDTIEPTGQFLGSSVYGIEAPGFEVLV